MTQMIKRIKGINIYVTDQQRALDFYKDVLGLEVRNDQAYNYEGKSYRLIVVAPVGAESGFNLEPAELYASYNQAPGAFLGITFAVADVDALHEQFKAAGVTVSQEPTTEWWGRTMMFTDPDGNQLVGWQDVEGA